MNDRILKLFNRAIPGEKSSRVFSEAMKLGYLVHPDVCQEDVLAWIPKFNPNTTFYQTWSDVTSKSRLELLIDQFIHYSTTYGTDFQGEPYIQNEPTVVDFTTYKVILPITVGEVISKCETLLSGIALKQETVEDIVYILSSLRHTPERVKNREAKMLLFDKMGKLPEEPSEMVRFLIYKASGSTLLIKNKETLEAIKDLDVTSYIEAYGYEKLASVFFRFKPIFLAFKKSKPAINKLRRLADKFHIPMNNELILSDILMLPEKVKGLNSFKKILLLQAINVKRKELSNRAFVVRNQKLFIKEEKVNFKPEFEIAYKAIYDSLIEGLKRKACKISLPKGVTLTMPTSEKSFIGNYPLGTSFDLSGHHAIIGINWRKENGADDLDLSLIDTEGEKIGWNSAYQTTGIVYSGDMTSANPEATELIYASKGFKEGIIKVNLYRGDEKSKFRFFVAKEKINQIKPNYMVDPNNILFSVDCEMDSKEKSLAVISEGKLILAQLRTGKGRVSGNSITNEYTKYALETSDCYLSLAQALTDAGFEITDKNPDIDLNDLSKETLIGLLQ